MSGAALVTPAHPEERMAVGEQWPQAYFQYVQQSVVTQRLASMPAAWLCRLRHFLQTGQSVDAVAVQECSLTVDLMGRAGFE